MYALHYKPQIVDLNLFLNARFHDTALLLGKSSREYVSSPFSPDLFPPNRNSSRLSIQFWIRGRAKFTVGVRLASNLTCAPIKRSEASEMASNAGYPVPAPSTSVVFIRAPNSAGKSQLFWRRISDTKLNEFGNRCTTYRSLLLALAWTLRQGRYSNHIFLNLVIIVFAVLKSDHTSDNECDSFSCETQWFIAVFRR